MSCRQYLCQNVVLRPLLLQFFFLYVAYSSMNLPLIVLAHSKPGARFYSGQTVHTAP